MDIFVETWYCEKTLSYYQCEKDHVGYLSCARLDDE